jgi:hypothetical protein
VLQSSQLNRKNFIDNLEELEKNFMTQLDEHYKFEGEIMDVETKGPVSMKTDKKGNKIYGEGDIIEQDAEINIRAEKKRSARLMMAITSRELRRRTQSSRLKATNPSTSETKIHQKR